MIEREMEKAGVWGDRDRKKRDKGGREEVQRMRRWPSYPSLSLISGPWGTVQIAGPQLLRNAASHSSLLFPRFCKITSRLSEQSSCENTSWLFQMPEKTCLMHCSAIVLLVHIHWCKLFFIFSPYVFYCSLFLLRMNEFLPQRREVRGHLRQQSSNKIQCLLWAIFPDIVNHIAESLCQDRDLNRNQSTSRVPR